jgi:hypothetical protein
MTVIFQISVEINSVSKIQIIQIIHQKSSIHIQKSMIFIIRIMPKSSFRCQLDSGIVPSQILDGFCPFSSIGSYE